jgi:site-specific DNA recombinase
MNDYSRLVIAARSVGRRSPTCPTRAPICWKREPRSGLKELVDHSTVTVESIAKRESCSIRKVNMTITLAFLAPDLVKAAIEGRLPHGMGVARLVDAPAEWSRQHQVLGLRAK